MARIGLYSSLVIVAFGVVAPFFIFKLGRLIGLTPLLALAFLVGVGYALAHPPPLVGAGGGGGSRGPRRLSNAPSLALRRTARPPSSVLPHKGGGGAVGRFARKLKSRKR